MRLAGAVHGNRRVHHGTHASGGHERPDVLAQVRDDRGPLDERAGTQRGAGHGEPPREQQPEVDLPSPPPLQADDDEPPARREAAQVLVERARAEDVEHDVDAAPVGRLEHGRRDVVVGVRDRDVGPEPPDERAARSVPGRRDDTGAEGGGELDHERADAARATVDEHRLAGAQPRRAHEVGPRRGRGLGQCGGVAQGHAVGHGEGEGRGHDGAFRVPTARQQGADRVADLPPLDVGTDDDDAPRDLEPGPRRCAGGRRVAALALEDVRPVDPGRDDVDEELSRPGLYLRGVRPRKDLGPTG